MEQTTIESNGQQEAPAAGLTIQDLTLTLQVIQVATNRGAFKAEELTAIGGLYDRVIKFLDAAGALAPAPEATPSPEEATPEAPKAPVKKAAKGKGK